MRLLRAYGPSGKAPAVLYFGDSTSRVVHWEDWSKKSLAATVRAQLAGGGMCEVTQVGYHVGVYRALVDALAVMPRRPRCVVVPLNVRSFSPSWAGNPNFRFREIIEAAESYAADPGAGIAVVPPLPRDIAYSRTCPDQDAWRQFLDMPVTYPDSAMHRVGDFVAVIAGAPGSDGDRRRLETIFTFHYRFELRPDEPRLHDVGALFSRAAELGCRVVAYIPPLNWEAGCELLGASFAEDIARTARTIAEATGSPDVHDWSMLLPGDCFFHKFEATGHLNENGRRQLARRIATAVTTALADS